MQRSSLFMRQDGAGEQPQSGDAAVVPDFDAARPLPQVARPAAASGGDGDGQPLAQAMRRPPRQGQGLGPTLVQRIKDKLSVVEYASRFTQLKATGANKAEFNGKCPAPNHDDKAPSFYANADNGLFHCHGCGISGNVIQLYAIMNGLDPVDAKFDLGRELGVFNERVLDSAEAMLASAARRFHDQLARKEDALAYLRERGLRQETIERFNIGFCWGREFLDFREEAQQRTAIETGLAREETGKAYMAGRITFPVRDASGRTVGFGGRLVPSPNFEARGPKYMNGPETAWFKKSELLYGFYEAGSGISRTGYAVVVEGYMDVAVLHQEGLDNTVGVMGASANNLAYTALWAKTKRAIFCLDGDAAGDRGALRSVMEAAPTMEDGCEIGVARLPAGMDPDQYVLQYGAGAFRNLCERAVPLSRFLMEARSAHFDLSYPEGRVAFLEEAKSVASVFAAAPTLREQIVTEARAINAASLVDFALEVTGVGEKLEQQTVRDAIALLQRRLSKLDATAPSADPSTAAPAKPTTRPR
jgi:DNA primase